MLDFLLRKVVTSLAITEILFGHTVAMQLRKELSLALCWRYFSSLTTGDSFIKKLQIIQLYNISSASLVHVPMWAQLCPLG